ncbi:MAG TPA: glycosyltransferase family 2 protein [Candidatus Nitrosocosmicus sp.]|nr:glycosyltransferase family 2 protein [Candidatus Nitrosocosmicus sp.]
MSTEKTSEPSISIIIVHYETPHYALKLLETLGTGTNIEILLVDNSRTNELQDQIIDTFPSIRYLYTGKNLGFSGGINYGLLEARGEWNFVLNSDTKASIQDIKKLIMITKSKNYLVAAPKLLAQDSSVQNNVGFLPTFTKDPINWLRNKPRFLDCKNIFEEKEVSLLSGTAMLFHKSVIEEIGYFDDENYFIDFVDFDFSRRLMEHKISILYVPQVQIIHYTDIPFKPEIMST